MGTNARNGVSLAWVRQMPWWQKGAALALVAGAGWAITPGQQTLEAAEAETVVRYIHQNCMLDGESVPGRGTPRRCSEGMTLSGSGYSDALPIRLTTRYQVNDGRRDLVVEFADRAAAERAIGIDLPGSRVVVQQVHLQRLGYV